MVTFNLVIGTLLFSLAIQAADAGGHKTIIEIERILQAMDRQNETKITDAMSRGSMTIDAALEATRKWLKEEHELRVFLYEINGHTYTKPILLPGPDAWGQDRREKLLAARDLENQKRRYKRQRELRELVYILGGGYNTWYNEAMDRTVPYE